MLGVLLGAGHRVRDRVPDDRMHEARRPVLPEHFQPHQLRRQVRGPIHREVRDCGRVAKVAAVTQDCERLREAQSGRVEAVQPCPQLQRGGVDAAKTDHILERMQLARISGSFEGVQEFSQIERIAPGGAMRQRADIVGRPAPERLANDGRNRLPAQQRRAKRRRRRLAHDDQRLRSRRGLVRTQGRDERNVRAVQARRQVGEPACRRLVGPVHVVDGQHEGSMVGEVDRQPVESMQDGEAGVVRGTARVVPLKERSDRSCRAGEQRFSVVRNRVHEATFEELPHDAEGKVAFELGSAGPQDRPLLPSRDRAGGLEQGRLADSGAGLDQHDTAAAHEGGDRRQLGVAFDEVGHGAIGTRF
jgi:hypothetical protein